jgi:hypothetical protein
MKNLTFEFSNFDRVINLDCHTLLLFKAKSSFIEANLIIFGKKEINYLFTLDNNCILDTLQVVFDKNKLFFVWQNIESNIILSIYRIELEHIYNKNQTIVSYDYQKTCINPLINFENNKIIIFWLESNCFNLDYSKFEVKKNLYEIDETKDDIYVNLIDSSGLIDNIDINLNSNVYSSHQYFAEKDYYFIYSYKNKFNMYKILFYDHKKLNSFYINTNEKNIKSVSTFYIKNKIYIFWINDQENIYGRIIEKRKKESILEKETINSFRNAFDLFYKNNLVQEIENNKLIKIPLKLDKEDLVELLLYSTGKNSFITIFDSKNEAKMQIKFDVNKLISIDNKIISNDFDIVSLSLPTDISTSHIIFFKYKIINDFLVCYQNREKKSEYNISKIEEILVEINKGVNEINDNLIKFDNKNISIFKNILLV